MNPHYTYYVERARCAFLTLSLADRLNDMQQKEGACIYSQTSLSDRSVGRSVGDRGLNSWIINPTWESVVHIRSLRLSKRNENKCAGLTPGVGRPRAHRGATRPWLLHWWERKTQCLSRRNRYYNRLTEIINFYWIAKRRRCVYAESQPAVRCEEEYSWATPLVVPPRRPGELGGRRL